MDTDTLSLQCGRDGGRVAQVIDGYDYRNSLCRVVRGFSQPAYLLLHADYDIGGAHRFLGQLDNCSIRGREAELRRLEVEREHVFIIRSVSRADRDA